jgi:hypothetical protein
MSANSAATSSGQMIVHRSRRLPRRAGAPPNVRIGFRALAIRLGGRRK